MTLMGTRCFAHHLKHRACLNPMPTGDNLRQPVDRNLLTIHPQTPSQCLTLWHVFKIYRFITAPYDVFMPRPFPLAPLLYYPQVTFQWSLNRQLVTKHGRPAKKGCETMVFQVLFFNCLNVFSENKNFFPNETICAGSNPHATALGDSR
jgi:hypothetical protein